MQKFTIAALAATLTSAAKLQQALTMTDADQVWTTSNDPDTAGEFWTTTNSAISPFLLDTTNTATSGTETS